MNYKHLMLVADADPKAYFNYNIKPYLNKHEHYYVIYNSDIELVGYAYRCARIELMCDLMAYTANNRHAKNGYKYNEYIIHTFALWPDGTPRIIAMEEF